MNVFYDKKTQLFWETPSPVEKNREWALNEADNYVRELNNREYGGFNDWRLPTLQELLTLAPFSFFDYASGDNKRESYTAWRLFKEENGQEARFAIVPELIPSTGKDGWYWTVTPREGTQEFYLVNFKDANINTHIPTQEFYIRCVRG